MKLSNRIAMTIGDTSGIGIEAAQLFHDEGRAGDRHGSRSNPVGRGGVST